MFLLMNIDFVFFKIYIIGDISVKIWVTYKVMLPLQKLTSTKAIVITFD